MKLNILERIALIGVIPREGSALTLRIIRELQSKLSFTEKEMKTYKMKNRTMSDGGVTITWDNDFSLKEEDFLFGEVATGIIKRELLKLDSQNKLRMEMLSVYEKFIEGEATPKQKEVKKDEQKSEKS